MKSHFLLKRPVYASGLTRYDVDASHLCWLPGIKCEVCKSVWACTGVEYPTIDCDLLSSLEVDVGSSPVSVERFHEIVSIIGASISRNIIIVPGTEFGSLIGGIKGVWEKVVWQSPWTVLLEKHCFDMLNSRGLDLIGREADLTDSSGRRSPQLIELEVCVGADLHRRSFSSPQPQPCAACGRVQRDKPDQIVIDKHSLNDAAVQRIRTLPTHLVANEDFVSASNDLGLDELDFSEVAVE